MPDGEYGHYKLNSYMVYVRKATPADSEQIRSIVEQSWEIAFTDAAARKKIYRMIREFYPQGKLNHEINHHISAFLLAIDGELAVAFASYKFDPVEETACELISLYCLPQTQGKGIDELLINEIIKNTIAAGGNKIFAVLTHDNGPADLLRRLNFKLIKTDDQQREPGMFVMAKNLEIPFN
ncbi:GNAT family N-acetyltransferase [Mucilaginibacter sp.]|uniref:GNAT family N-acetyltransferase n=1 Tax=Mucilaginibacter sp. TaxID=1882438 RepID=UPI0025F27E6C|nr:GNAT family N-acetyltransferase [Mucilaginibacter sp.]